MPAHETGLSIHGDRETGQDVRSANVTAVITLANILKTSLGPQGEEFDSMYCCTLIYLCGMSLGQEGENNRYAVVVLKYSDIIISNANPFKDSRTIFN
jgi:hypothetical protein